MAVDMFLKLDGIEGESRDKTHGKEIQISTFSWSMHNSSHFQEGGGGGAGKVSIGDIQISKNYDKSTPKLVQRCCDGKHIKNGIVTFRKAAGDTPLEYLKVTLTDIIVTSVSHSGHGGSDDVLTESLTLGFAQFKTEYFEQTQEGTGQGAIPASWNIPVGAP